MTSSPARRVVCAALTTYQLGVVALALLPWPPSWVEWLIAGAAALTVPGLVALGVGAPLPGRRWAYLVTGGVGLVTLTLYVMLTRDDAYPALPLALFLASGVVGGYGAHLAAGMGGGR